MPQFCLTLGETVAKKSKFYVTTPIYYVNDVPHIGHAYTTIAADILARWHRSSGDNVFFLTGTDEHGLKILRAAEKAGKPPKEFVNELSGKFKGAFDNLNISYDQFIRTTDPKHERIVKALIKKIIAKGDIYLGKYKGPYCVGCEKYLPADEIVNGNCIIHQKPVEHIEEETYFFRMSKYAGQLAELYEKNPELIQPKGKMEEIRNRILTEGLKDVSVSRTSFNWGIPFPGNKKHVVYVWFDALPNYISALGWPSGSKFKKFWPADYHLIAKDILWFHTVLWHSMLLSAGIKLPKVIFAHGYWTVDGEKMSKTTGNVVDPVKMKERYGADGFRYFLFREIPFGEDGDFSETMLVQRYNSELADELGNLVARVLTLIEKFSDGKIPKAKKGKRDNEDIGIVAQFDDTIRHAEEHIGKLEFHKALEKIFAYVHLANKYVADEKPWELAKQNSPHINMVLYNLAEALRLTATLIWPFMPETAEKISQQLGLAKVPQLKKLKWGQLKAGTKIKKGDILFEKIDAEKIGVVEPFEKLDLRVAEIKAVEEIPEAEKLYKLKLSLGKLGYREIVAGIKQHYKPGELKGKKIIIVANLKPAKLRGVLSQGMLLAAEDKSKNVGILTVDETEAGADVFIVGINKKPVENLDLADFIKITLTSKAGSVYYKDKMLQTYKEKVKVDKVKEGQIR
jgi:methionyl-tRNA synthetase